jgi:SAM-dependent methyltransferase
MSRSHETVVADQYGGRAAAYVTSATHASGADLDQVEALARTMPAARALDLGCGGGHVAYRMAPHVAAVTAYDLTPSMLDAVLREAAQRGLPGITVQQGAAERLPFADASFDLVVTRFSAHHWRDLQAGLREMRRVLAPGGRALVIDTVSPGVPLLDTFLQTIELLRDPSHGRNYSLAEWHQALAQARLAAQASQVRRLRLDFASWVARMNTPPVHVAAMRSLQAGASEDVRRYFELEPDGSFTFDSLAIELR